MNNKRRVASVRPSPLASIVGMISLIAMLAFVLSTMSDIAGSFLIIWVLAAAGGIVYFLANLLSFSKSARQKIPMTAEDVIELSPGDGEETELDFEAKLRKLESLKMDGLLKEDEYRRKRDEVLEEKTGYRATTSGLCMRIPTAPSGSAQTTV